MTEGLIIQIVVNIVSIIVSGIFLYSKLNREIGEIKTAIEYLKNDHNRK